MLERIGFEREARQVRPGGTEEHRARVATHGVGECEGVGVAELEAQPQPEHLRRELLGGQHVAAIGQFGQEQHGHGARGIAQDEANERVERAGFELRGHALERPVVRDERERGIEFGEQARWAHRRRRAIGGAAFGAHTDVHLPVLGAASGRRHDVRDVRRPLQRAIERIGGVHDNVGKCRTVLTEGRPTENASTVERVIRWGVPAQLLALIETQPRHTGGEEGGVGVRRRSARRQIEMKRKTWLHGRDDFHCLQASSGAFVPTSQSQSLILCEYYSNA